MPQRRPKITGRPVMITGAASGIGRSLATRLSRLGSPVAIADVDDAGLKATAAALTGPVLTRVLDVRDAADQVRFADEVREWLPAPLAAVFNNAGVAVTSPEKAAQIIHHGIERGKARILVGPDAYVFDALARIAPTHYYSVLGYLQSKIRANETEAV
jgi:NAD(P)-dependent dehydrogenase (short-subunit alcohol dehydrogenase family)